MEEEFVFWVRNHLKQPALAEKLHQLIAGGGTLAMFMEVLLAQVNVLSMQEKEELLSYITKMEDKNELERRKMLADQMMERGKFEAAILEYWRILNGERKHAFDDELLAKIWHNLGCCYGRMLYDDQALECFKTAYSYKRLLQTKQAVSYIVDRREQAEDIKSVKEDDSFVHLISSSDQAQRNIRYQQLKERIDEYRRSAL
jgi:tetratricopeptide (TPR) repeat protein